MTAHLAHRLRKLRGHRPRLQQKPRNGQSRRLQVGAAAKLCSQVLLLQFVKGDLEEPRSGDQLWVDRHNIA